MEIKVGSLKITENKLIKESFIESENITTDDGHGEFNDLKTSSTYRLGVNGRT